MLNAALCKMCVHVLFRHGWRRAFEATPETNQQRKDNSTNFSPILEKKSESPDVFLNPFEQPKNIQALTTLAKSSVVNARVNAQQRRANSLRDKSVNASHP